MVESTFTYARHAVGDDDRRNVGTLLEGIIPNGFHAIRDVYRCKTGTATESICPYACHTIRNGDGGQAGAASERSSTYTRNAVRDNGVHATKNEFVGTCLYDSITIVSGIVFGVVCVHFNC